MATSQYVKPQALDNFALQGVWRYRPFIAILEASSVEELNQKLREEIATAQAEPNVYFVIKDVTYQAAYSPPNMKYSLCVHAELAVRS